MRSPSAPDSAYEALRRSAMRGARRVSGLDSGDYEDAAQEGINEALMRPTENPAQYASRAARHAALKRLERSRRERAHEGWKDSGRKRQPIRLTPQQIETVRRVRDSLVRYVCWHMTPGGQFKKTANVEAIRALVARRCQALAAKLGREPVSLRTGKGGRPAKPTPIEAHERRRGVRAAAEHFVDAELHRCGFNARERNATTRVDSSRTSKWRAKIARQIGSSRLPSAPLPSAPLPSYAELAAPSKEYRRWVASGGRAADLAAYRAWLATDAARTREKTEEKRPKTVRTPQKPQATNARRTRESTALEKAGEWLWEQLSSKGRPARELLTEASKAGHSKATLRRAATALDIQRTRIGGRHGEWVWTRP